MIPKSKELYLIKEDLIKLGKYKKRWKRDKQKIQQKIDDTKLWELIYGKDTY